MAQAQLHIVAPDPCRNDAAATNGRPSRALAVRVRGLCKSFNSAHGPVRVLDQVDLDIELSERLVLLGPSGCGKTTLLRCIAGLEVPDAGEVEIDGKLVFSAARGIALPPERRGLSMVFQSYALWPHKTAAQNIAYPLENRKVDKSEIARRVQEVLALVGCDGLGGRYPSQLSGGQQQRIALARAVVGSDSLVLFDEPLSNVDAKVRESLRIELIALQKRLRFAAVYVTHDQVEATAIAHRMAVMRAGRFAQLGSPREIYDEPASSYVAEFTGISNRLKGRVIAQSPGKTVVSTSIGNLESSVAGECTTGQEVEVLLRPECLQLRAERDTQGNAWLTRIESTMFLGGQTEYALSGPDGYLLARQSGSAALDEDATVWVTIQPRHVKVFPAEAP